MSGIIGHSMYAILASREAESRGLPITPLIHRHYASYLCGSYLGCDIQTMPEAVCIDTGEEVGYGTAPLDRSPLTGGTVRGWSLEFNGKQYRPEVIHRTFYGRSHLVFGWNGQERVHTVPWDHLADYCSAVFEDAMKFLGSDERELAYLFGWMAHIVGDSLIKSIQPGIELTLLDGKYTPANRPIQDLVTFHEIGVKEFGLNWAALLSDLAAAPVEPIQLHYMRASRPLGALKASFPNAWSPELKPLLSRVLEENRRYQKIRNPRLIKKYALRETRDGWQCSDELSRQTGGLTYSEMTGLARRAGFRLALRHMGEAIAELFEQVIDRTPRLRDTKDEPCPSFAEITAKWKESK